MEQYWKSSFVYYIHKKQILGEFLNIGIKHFFKKWVGGGSPKLLLTSFNPGDQPDFLTFYNCFLQSLPLYNITVFFL